MSEGKQLVSFASKADLPEIKKLIDVPLSMANFTDTAQVGTDVNFVEPEQGTALFAACKLGHIDVRNTSHFLFFTLSRLYLSYWFIPEWMWTNQLMV